jgi:hypothetical protein
MCKSLMCFFVAAFFVCPIVMGQVKVNIGEVRIVKYDREFNYPYIAFIVNITNNTKADIFFSNKYTYPLLSPVNGKISFYNRKTRGTQPLFIKLSQYKNLMAPGEKLNIVLLTKNVLHLKDNHYDSAHYTAALNKKMLTEIHNSSIIFKSSVKDNLNRSKSVVKYLDTSIAVPANALIKYQSFN